MSVIEPARASGAERRGRVGGVLRAYVSGTIFGEQVGEGPLDVLALHGWARDHRDFDPVLAGLQSLGITAASIDLPGFGTAPTPEEAWDTERYAAFAEGMLGELGSRPIIVGHSFGGRVALRLAARCGDRLGGLVLCGVPLWPSERRSPPPAAYRLVRGLRRVHVVSESTLERARERYGSTDYRRAHGVMRSVLVKAVNERYEESIAAVSVAVELVWGELDEVVPVAQAANALSHFREAHLSVLPGIGHLVPSEAPTAIIDAVARLRR